MSTKTMSETSTKSLELLTKENLSRIQGSITLSPENMKELKIKNRDLVLVRGKRKKKAICIAHSRKNYSDLRVGMNKTVRYSLGVAIMDLVRIQLCPNDLREGTFVHITPVYDTVGITMNWHHIALLLKNQIKREITTFTEGNHFILEMDSMSVEFKILVTSPSPYCILTNQTLIQCRFQSTNKSQKQEVSSKFFKLADLADKNL